VPNSIFPVRLSRSEPRLNETRVWPQSSTTVACAEHEHNEDPGGEGTQSTRVLIPSRHRAGSAIDDRELGHQSPKSGGGGGAATGGVSLKGPGAVGGVGTSTGGIGISKGGIGISTGGASTNGPGTSGGPPNIPFTARPGCADATKGTAPVTTNTATRAATRVGEFLKIIFDFSLMKRTSYVLTHGTDAG